MSAGSRTAARRRGSASSGERPLVRGLRAGATAPAIDFDVRPVYDFVASLSNDAGSTDDLPERDRRWLREAWDSLPDGVREDRESLFGSELTVHVIALAVDRPHLSRAADFVEAVDRAPAADVLAPIFEESARSPELAPLISAALRGDSSVLPRLESGLHDWLRAERIELLRDPERSAERIRAVLRAWRERFEPLEERVRAMISADAARRRREADRLDPLELIERTTGGIRWLPEPGVRRVVLAPSYFSRPYNFVISGGDWRLFAYPIADDVLDEAEAGAPPQAILRLHRALGDETRLRILKLLAQRDWYLTEIASELQLSKPTIKHHLSLMRVAGLVTITDQGAMTYYSLRPDTIEQASPALSAFLGRYS